MTDVRRREAGSARPGGRMSDGRLSGGADDLPAVASLCEIAKAPSRGRSGAARFAGGRVGKPALEKNENCFFAVPDLHQTGAYL